MKGRGFQGAPCGLWSAVAASGRVNVVAWRRAAGSGEFIGVCCLCGGYLAAAPADPYRGSPIEWFIARCVSCGQECAAPNGRTRG